MKKKFLSSILALAMVLVAMTPVMADYKGSPVWTDTKVETITKSVSVGGQTISIAAADSDVDETTPTLKFNTVTRENGEKYVSSVSEKLSSNETAAAVFELKANERAAKLIDNGVGVEIDFKVDGAKQGDNYYCLHVNADGSTDPLKCSVDKDGVVTIKGINKCSPFILVKVSSSNSSSNSGSKVVTCEEAEGKGWVWSEAKKACVYSVTNTSTK